MTAPTVPLGTRLAIFGRTGSGKTYLTRWFLLRSPPRQRWVVLDTKHDPEYSDWRPRGGLLSMKALERAWNNQRIVVLRPYPAETNPEVLDAYLGTLHEAWDNFGTVVDEAMQVCPSAMTAGPGITGLLTRGRVRGQAAIVGTQRPARVPRFVFSEASAFAVMALNIEQDRKSAYGFTGRPEVMRKLPAREWLYYDVAGDSLTTYSPVSILPATSTWEPES